MPRTARASVGNLVYHAINRGNGRAKVFHNDSDYADFVRLIGAANARVDMRIAAYCVMPNHFHLVLWPREDGDLGRWMQWLMTAQVRGHHRRHGTEGHVWPGRFKAFPVQTDEHLLAVLRYVERNPVRAGLVASAREWRWSSAAAAPPADAPELRRPIALPSDWTQFVDRDESTASLASVRECVNRGAPFGTARWAGRTAAQLGLEASLNPRGRPRKSGTA